MTQDGHGNPTMISDLVAKGVPGRLAPFLAQWDYVAGMTLERLEGLADEEYLWEPAETSWTVRPDSTGRPRPDAAVWDPSSSSAPPRTLAWTITHLGNGLLSRTDYLTGSHSLRDEDLTYPMAPTEGIALLRRGLAGWRAGLAEMTDVDLDTVGRSAYPGGLDPELPLIEIVWWVSKELLWHAADAWFVRDLYAMRRA